MTRGSVVRLRSDRRARGNEQRGERFGVVLQHDALGALTTIIVAPTSTRARPTRFRPEIVVGGERTRVLTEQLGAVDATRLGDTVSVLTFDELRAVERAVAHALDLRLAP